MKNPAPFSPSVTPPQVLPNNLNMHFRLQIIKKHNFERKKFIDSRKLKIQLSSEWSSS